MVSYKCTICCKIFNHKYNYLRHKKRIYSCKKTVKKNIDLKKTVKFTKNNTKKMTHVIKTSGLKTYPKNTQNPSHFIPSKKQVKVTHTVKTKKNGWDKKNPYFENFEKTTDIFFNEGGQNEKNKIDIEKNIKSFKCTWCDRIYKHKYHRTRHYKTCKAKKYDEESVMQINELQTQLDLLKKKNNIDEIIKVKENQNIVVTNNIVINNDNSINKDNSINDNSINDNSINDNSTKINVVAYGKENMANIPNSVKKAILNKGFRAVEALTRYTHLNKNFPENHNIYNSNLKNSLLNVYSGDKWLVQDEKDIIDDIYDIKKCHLEDWAEELIDDIGSMTKKKINRYLDYSGDDDVMKTIKRQLSLLLYNYKEIVFKTIKEKNLHKK